MSRITNRLGWSIAGALAIALLATLAGVIYAGPLAPPAAPSATGPTQIFALPYAISAAGTYIVQADLTCSTCTSGQNGITISAGNVTLDLNGFTLNGVGGSGSGVSDTSPGNVTVENGSLASWGANGIFVQDGAHAVITHVVTSGNSGSGILVNALSVAASAQISDCVSRGNTNSGIGVGNLASATIESCESANNGAHGIGIVMGATGAISGNRVHDNTFNGIVAGAGTTVSNNTIRANGATGIEVDGGGNDISNNSITGNNTATGSLAAINVLAGANRNRIDGNFIEANNATHAVEVDGSSNTITRNTAGNSTAVAFAIPGAGNTFGPVQIQSTPLSNPWANIVY